MEVELLFPSSVGRSARPEFLDPVRAVLTEYLARVPSNPWNVCQSESMFDPRLDGLLKLIAQDSYQMLADQGYDMARFQTNVSEFWGQEFMRNGQHIEHIHGNGAQVTGFYFSDVPEGSSVPILFDPRPGKKQINLPQAKIDDVTFASERILFEVKPGDLIMFNSWLGHGFTQHGSDLPFRFIHFNVMVESHNQLLCKPRVEVI